MDCIIPFKSFLELFSYCCFQKLVKAFDPSIALG